MNTQKETRRLLCKSIMNRLENQKAITFPARLRQIIQDEINQLISPLVLTDQELKEKTLAKMGAKLDLINDSAFTEGDAYRAASTVIRNSFGNEILNGFYFQKPPKTIANIIVEYFMRSSHIDDVYETDDELEQKIVEVMQKFNPKDLH